jgi:hypothetical protein
MLGLPKKSYPYAEKLGLAYQYINFIRDINEDIKLGRTYFPQSELSRFGLSSLSFDTSFRIIQPQFNQFIDINKSGVFIPILRKPKLATALFLLDI